MVLIIEISKSRNILATENQPTIINDVIEARIQVQRKFTADQYAVYKWLGRKYSPSPQGGGLFP